ncbi:MAG: serine hydrolase [Legionella sp.]|nr:serine hydrolase [Legionella sp.]
MTIKTKQVVMYWAMGLVSFSSFADSTCTLLPTADYQTPFCQNQLQKIMQFTPNVFNTENQNVVSGQTLGEVIGIYRHINDGEQICYISCGLQRLGGSAPNEHTMFELASISKTFTGSVLGTLVYKQAVKPADLARSYLPASFSLMPNEASVYH